MLKERVLTAIVLAAVLLGVMLGLPPVATVWLLTVLVLIGAWEWAGFIGENTPATRAAFTVAVALALVACLYFYTSYPGFVLVVVTVAVAWWFIAFLWLCLAPGRVTPVTAALAGIPVARALLAGAGARHVHHAEHALGAVHARARLGRRHRRVFRGAVVRPCAAGAARVAQEDLGRRARRRRSERRRRLGFGEMAVRAWTPGRS